MFYKNNNKIAFLHDSRLMQRSHINKLKEKGSFTNHSKYKGQSYSAEVRKKKETSLLKNMHMN